MVAGSVRTSRLLAAALLALVAGMPGGARADETSWLEATDRAVVAARLGETIRDNRAALAEIVEVSAEVAPFCRAASADCAAPFATPAGLSRADASRDPLLADLCGCCAGLEAAGLPDGVVRLAATLDLGATDENALSRNLDAALGRTSETEMEALERRIRRLVPRVDPALLASCRATAGTIAARVASLRRR